MVRQRAEHSGHGILNIKYSSEWEGDRDYEQRMFVTQESKCEENTNFRPILKR